MSAVEAVQLCCWLDAVTQLHISNRFCRAARQQQGLPAAVLHVIFLRVTRTLSLHG